MELPNLFRYGTLFAFSGMDGENAHADDFAGMTMHSPVEIRFDGEVPVTLSVPVKSDRMDFLLSDALSSEELLLLFADKTTVCGKTRLPVRLKSEPEAPSQTRDGVFLLTCNGFCYALYREDDRFVFCREKTADEAVSSAKRKIHLDMDALCEQRLDYYRALPECRNQAYEKLYYKCLSVNKVNVYSPQDGFDCRFTTPDRLPHSHMWLWDSMFHAIAMAQYDPSLAKDAIRAVLLCQREDGFLPHMMRSRTDYSSITQPQVAAWAALTVFRKTGDLAFLRECAAPIAKFLLWFSDHRDENRNGLPEWETDFSNVRCRCDESGMDNSPRFDTTERLDAIDCACFLAYDCRCLSEIYRLLGDAQEAERFSSIAEKTAEKINELLWDENLGAYCDRGFSGELTGVLTNASFLPLFAGVCSGRRAARLVSLLEDPTLFKTPLPVPSVARNHRDYGTDMWRGGVWLNYNYMIILGLRRYGYHALADAIKNQTLQSVNRWFETQGGIFEFYDAQDETSPLLLNRKGPQPSVPDYRLHYHAISDFNWSACFTMLMIQNCDADPEMIL